MESLGEKIKKKKADMTWEERARHYKKKFEESQAINKQWHVRYHQLEMRLKNIEDKPSPEKEIEAMQNAHDKVLLENMELKQQLRKLKKK